jgi:hypothetical protein
VQTDLEDSQGEAQGFRSHLQTIWISIAFGVDEKPQMRSLEQTQTALRISGNFPEGRTHEYNRNGTIDLFAALETRTGNVATQFRYRHREQESRGFLSTLDRSAPEEFEVQVFVNILSAHIARK